MVKLNWFEANVNHVSIIWFINNIINPKVVLQWIYLLKWPIIMNYDIVDPINDHIAKW